MICIERLPEGTELTPAQERAWQKLSDEYESIVEIRTGDLEVVVYPSRRES